MASQEIEKEIMIKDIHPGTKLKDRDLTAVGKGECRGQEETASQEIMTRDIHPGIKLVDKALTAVE